MKSQRIGQYELLGLLGEGGIGQVYVARDTEVGRQAAIKTLRPEYARDTHFIERFFAEAQSMGRLEPHPNITTLFGLHADRRQPAIAMELVRGHTLSSVLQKVQRLSLREALAVIVQAAAGLTYAHREGVIHRDIKPDNLMVTERGLVKIMDFGISRTRGTQRLTRAGQVFGTLLYAPPEQIRGGETDERSDLYSLAIVAYEMLCGSPPFVFENEYELQTAHMQTPPPPLSERVPGLPAEIEAAVMRALAKRPEDRFQSVDEFARALGANAIAGEAAEILEKLVSNIFRGAPSAATRLISNPIAGGSSSRDGAGGQFDRNSGEQQLRSLPGIGFIPATMRGPAIVLAAVILGVGAGVGYVLFSGPAESDKQVATISTSGSQTGQPAQGQQEKTQEKTGQRPSTVMVEPYQKTAPPPPNTNEKPPPISGILPPPSPPHPATPEPPPTAPAPSTPIVMPPPPPQPTRPTPTFTASIHELGVIMGSMYMHGGKTFTLYGVDDPQGVSGPHQAAVTAVIKSILGDDELDCYAKGASEFQCYVNGRDDLALLLLHRGLVVARGNAPPEYR
ncbi:MAG TPA: serine/threonine-protein kinase [Stellaceae bacterium]|nr:serine/threonine-protein kinase [Stellaceae bacterium]